MLIEKLGLNANNLGFQVAGSVNEANLCNIEQGQVQNLIKRFVSAQNTKDPDVEIDSSIKGTIGTHLQVHLVQTQQLLLNKKLRSLRLELKN